MMNILYLVNELNCTDGVTAHLYYLLKELSKNKNLNLHILCAGGNCKEKFINLGINVVEKKELLHSARSYPNFLSSLKFLIKFIKQNKINIVHSHNHYAANLAYISSKFVNIKTVQTNHGIIPEGGMLKHFKAHKYTAVNEHIMEYIFKNKLAGKKNVSIVRHGISVPSENFKNDWEFVNVICASRFVKEKNTEVFIRAAASVNEKSEYKFKFFLCGSGPEENYLKLINEKLKAGVIFLGEVKNLTEVLGQTDIFVMATNSQSEGFPVALAEAALMDNFIITTEFIGLSPVFVSCKDGLTFEMNNHKDLAAKILFSVSNPLAVKELQKNFTSKARKLFDAETSAKKYLQIYREALI